MKNIISATRNTFCRLFTFLLLIAIALPASGQIIIDNCNTGAFSQNGPSSQNNISASGAIGGTRDVQIANTNFGLVNLNISTGFLQVRPSNNGSFPAALQGNYDLGWGNNDVLGGTDLNLNASTRTQIDVIFVSAPYSTGIMSVRFNRPGDADYSSATRTLHGPGTYTFPFSSFTGLNSGDIDGISIGFSNCIPDTSILIGQVQLSGVVVPLTLTSFTGQAEGSVNVLRWETQTEKDVQFHVVERSADGIRWQEVGRKNGLANSSVAVQSSLEDRSPLARAYYRLRSVDFDGKESRSNAILVTRADAQFGIISIFPSPAKDQVTIRFQATQEESVTVRVLDSTGRLMLEQTTTAVPDRNELPLSLSGLPTGIYAVTVSNGSRISAPVRMLRQ